MRFILQVTILFLIFAIRLSAQETVCMPTFPSFTYISTLQVSEDETGLQNDYEFITVQVTKQSVILHSDLWDDEQPITEGWKLVPIRRNKNGNFIYQWEGRSSTAFYRIPVIYDPKYKRWSCGYLTEKLCVGVDYTTYRNNLPTKNLEK